LNGQGSLWANVREAFFNDLGKPHDRSGPWQAVPFTGDFVQQGEKEEFEQLEEKVLGPLWDRLRELGSGNAVLLAVPGNHDLIRPDAKKPSAALKWLLKPELFSEIADDLFTGSGGEYRQVLHEAFAECSQWWDKVGKRSPLLIGEGILPGDISTTF
jgi:hypothetical protein